MPFVKTMREFLGRYVEKEHHRTGARRAPLNRRVAPTIAR
jgi:hypothetical protein